MSWLRIVTRGPARLSAAALLLIQGCGATEAPKGPAAFPGPEVVLDSGTIRGVADGDVLRYRGIRYASPPVGELRWRPPQPVARWRGVVPATTSGPACPQASDNAKESSDAEDCLTLDVTLPEKAGKKPRPVMVWLHGGGFNAGRGADYDPRRLAVQGDVVVVTVEFRLGVLGYLALPGMSGGGTFGLQDQQAALRWVRRNAAAFGGDAGNVTLFGESGGGIATCGHLTSPASRGLFHKAIIQSGTCGTVLLPNAVSPGTPRLPFWRPLKETYAATRTAARQVGCREAARMPECLRAKPVKELLKLTGYFAAASYGGPILPVAPDKARDFARVPVLSGHTSKEALMMAGVMSLLGRPITDANLSGLLRQGFGDQADEVTRRYPRDRYGTANEAWAAPYTDAIFSCPHVATQDALAKHTKVYAYVFGDDTAPPFIPTVPGFPAGAGHASELAYLFDVKDKPINLDGRLVPLTRTQQSVARDMVTAWATFARTGTPASSGKAWPRWQGGKPVAHLISERPGSTATTSPPRCDLFNRP
ncbi:carboxylesterase/lipase family protein [Nonomuraea gerenzanensis]|uniref:carboxylesterase/lipase family protein n=1 Tax=Nonomuraea gerenzanensis TaxID=93944 RepID=UPI001CDA42B7|nr:carboxylesterase family protein [Nonomuraea gerenzanensis]UBU11570.1 carboxylesterase family protein [Nonomuraea gerenzanensis]